MKEREDMKDKKVLRTLSAIEIEEVLAKQFNVLDVLLKIVDTEDGQTVCAEIMKYTPINKKWKERNK